MSRSEPAVGASPATRFFEWKAEGGLLQYYDKDTKLNVTVKLPFGFMVLDEVSQVGGGTKINGKYEGYWSNAVKNLDTQIITVKSKQGIVAQGLYSELKNRKGLNYVKGLYITYIDDDGNTQIGFLKLKGSALGAWFEFTKSHRNIYQGAFAIKGSELINGDSGDYNIPVFIHKSEVSPESEAKAIELDKELQAYFKVYFANKGSDEETHAMAATNGHSVEADAPETFEEELDEIPF